MSLIEEALYIAEEELEIAVKQMHPLIITKATALALDRTTAAEAVTFLEQWVQSEDRRKQLNVE